MAADDIVDLFIDRLLRFDPNVNVQVADRLKLTLRQEFGGVRAYVRRAPTQQTGLRLQLGDLDERQVPRTTRWRSRL